MFRPEDKDPLPLWENLIEGGVSVHDMPGVHVEMLSEPIADRLARLVRQHLDAADCGTSTPPDVVPARVLVG